MQSTASSPVLVYDGDCGFCTRSADWLTRRGDAQAHAAHTLPLSEEESLRALDAAGWMVEGRVMVWGAAAIAEALRHRGGVPAALGWALGLPLVRRVADVVYAWVARNRHRMPGATAQCRVEPEPPTRPWRRRLLVLAIATQVLVPAAALTHPPSRLGFQMFSGLGRTHVVVLDEDDRRLAVPGGLLPAVLRPDLPYARTLPEFLCDRVAGAATVTVRDLDEQRSVQC